MKAITNTLRDGVTAVATAPLVGGALRYAAVIANFGTLSIGFKAVVEKSKGLPREEAEALILAFCEKHRDAPLRACLNMGGFYIKVGQLLSGMPALPRPWAESLRSLQTDVPPRELARIVELIERDFGCSLEAVGLRDFSATPLGAASIGQVHSATLGGRRVVVKVMYPEVERFFRMDFQQIIALVGGVNKELVEPLERQQELFEMEFDYRREAANLRRMCTAVAPLFAHGHTSVRFPEPYDSHHPALPPLPSGSRVAAAAALVTRHVLVMDRCDGRTITSMCDELLETLAASKGTTPDAHRAAMRATAMSAAKSVHAGGDCAVAALGCVLATAEAAQRSFVGCAAAGHAAANAPRHALNAIARCCTPARAADDGARRAPCVELLPSPIAVQLGPGLVGTSSDRTTAHGVASGEHTALRRAHTAASGECLDRAEVLPAAMPAPRDTGLALCS